MRLFQAHCRLCRRPLPPERRWREVCDNCGDAYEGVLEEIRTAEGVLQRGADPRACYLSCVSALDAVDRLEQYEQAGVSVPGQTEPEDMRRRFAESARSYAIAVAMRNEKLPYAQKTGLPPLRSKPAAETKAGRAARCRACGEKGVVNSAGFCHACIRRATSFSRREMEEYAGAHSVRGFSEHEWQMATLDWKLERSKR